MVWNWIQEAEDVPSSFGGGVTFGGGPKAKVPGPRRELRKVVGPVNQVGDDGLEDGSHRQNIFLMGARVGYAETEKG